MRLSVKILGGEECDVSVDPQDSVEFLKREIEVKLKLDKQTEQRLLFRGKALQDGTPLSDYKLTEGSKLNLVVKRREEAKAQATALSAGGQESQNSSDNSSAVSGASSKTAKAGSSAFGGFSNKFLLSPSTSSSSLSSSSTPSTSGAASSIPVDKELFKSLRPHFASDSDTKKVVDTFLRIYHDRVASLSLDDLERITAHYNQTLSWRY